MLHCIVHRNNLPLVIESVRLKPFADAFNHSVMNTNWIKFTVDLRINAEYNVIITIEDIWVKYNRHKNRSRRLSMVGLRISRHPSKDRLFFGGDDGNIVISPPLLLLPSPSTGGEYQTLTDLKLVLFLQLPLVSATVSRLDGFRDSGC